MTAEYIDRVHTVLPQIDVGIYIPAVLKSIAQNPIYIENMKNIRVVAFGGAPLDQGRLPLPLSLDYSSINAKL
jgi:hypothetical protein